MLQSLRIAATTEAVPVGDVLDAAWIVRAWFESHEPWIVVDPELRRDLRVTMQTHLGLAMLELRGAGPQRFVDTLQHQPAQWSQRHEDVDLVIVCSPESRVFDRDAFEALRELAPLVRPILFLTTRPTSWAFLDLIAEYAGCYAYLDDRRVASVRYDVSPALGAIRFEVEAAPNGNTVVPQVRMRRPLRGHGDAIAVTAIAERVDEPVFRVHVTGERFDAPLTCGAIQLVQYDTAIRTPAWALRCVEAADFVAPDSLAIAALPPTADVDVDVDGDLRYRGVVTPLASVMRIGDLAELRITGNRMHLEATCPLRIDGKVERSCVYGVHVVELDDIALEIDFRSSRIFQVAGRHRVFVIDGVPIELLLRAPEPDQLVRLDTRAVLTLEGDTELAWMTQVVYRGPASGSSGQPIHCAFDVRDDTSSSYDTREVIATFVFALDRDTVTVAIADDHSSE